MESNLTHRTCTCVHQCREGSESARKQAVWEGLIRVSLTDLSSQTGPYSRRVFTGVPSCPELAYSPVLFRVLLLRRLCPLLPPSIA